MAARKTGHFFISVYPKTLTTPARPTIGSVFPQHTAISLCRISSLTFVIKLKKLKALPFLRVHSSFGKRRVSTLDGALDLVIIEIAVYIARAGGHWRSYRLCLNEAEMQLREVRPR